MLTSLHYYNHYRSFVARNSPNNAFAKRAWPADNIAPRTLSEKPAVLLNTSDTSKVVGYARALSAGIVGLKDSAKMFVHDMTTLEKNPMATFENHLQWIEEDLEGFISSYNKIQNISSARLNNHDLSRLAHSFRDFSSTNSEILNHLGIISHNAGGLTYHGFANTANRDAAQNAVETFKSAYSMARGFLKQPLTHHMNFRDLSYYYNYTIGDAGSNTFAIVQSGMLVDIIV